MLLIFLYNAIIACLVKVPEDGRETPYNPGIETVSWVGNQECIATMSECLADGQLAVYIRSRPPFIAIRSNAVGDVIIKCKDNELNLIVEPVNDIPTAQWKEQVLYVPADQSVVEYVDFLQNVSAGPQTAMDENNDSLFSPLQCIVSNDVLFSSSVIINLRDMQNTISNPTTGTLQLFPSGIPGESYIDCVLQDTGGGQFRLPSLLIILFS